jgi:phage gp45-like
MKKGGCNQMSKKAEVIDLEQSVAGQSRKRQIQLDSGRQVLVHSDEKEELLEIVEPGGEVVMKVRLTSAGPVITVSGAHLEVKSTETLSLEAKKVEIKAQEEAVIQSKGSLEVASSEKLDIRSADEIRVVGKMIHLN